MKKKKQTTQLNLLIRCVVAVYLIYLAHSIIKELDTAPNVRLMVAFAIAFTFAGVLIIAFTIKAYVNKEYKDFRDTEDEQGIEDIPADSPEEKANGSDDDTADRPDMKEGSDKAE